MYPMDESGYVIITNPKNNREVKPCIVSKNPNQRKAQFKIKLTDDSVPDTYYFSEEEKSMNFFKSKMKAKKQLKLSEMVEQKTKYEKYFSPTGIKIKPIVKDLLALLEQTKFSPEIGLLNIELLDKFCLNVLQPSEENELKNRLKRLQTAFSSAESRSINYDRKQTSKVIHYIHNKFYKIYDNFERAQYARTHPIYYINPKNAYNIEQAEIIDFIAPDEQINEAEIYTVTIYHKTKKKKVTKSLSNMLFYNFLFETREEAEKSREKMLLTARTTIREKKIPNLRAELRPQYRDNKNVIYLLFVVQLIHHCYYARKSQCFVGLEEVLIKDFLQAIYINCESEENANYHSQAQ